MPKCCCIGLLSSSTKDKHGSYVPGAIELRTNKFPDLQFQVKLEPACFFEIIENWNKFICDLLEGCTRDELYPQEGV